MTALRKGFVVARNRVTARVVKNDEDPDYDYGADEEVPGLPEPPPTEFGGSHKRRSADQGTLPSVCDSSESINCRLIVQGTKWQGRL